MLNLGIDPAGLSGIRRGDDDQVPPSSIAPRSVPPTSGDADISSSPEESPQSAGLTDCGAARETIGFQPALDPPRDSSVLLAVADEAR